MASQLLAFEQSVILMQMQVEESFLSVARSTGRPGVVVFDRGLLDIPACKCARAVCHNCCAAGNRRENRQDTFPGIMYIPLAGAMLRSGTDTSTDGSDLTVHHFVLWSNRFASGHMAVSFEGYGLYRAAVCGEI